MANPSIPSAAKQLYTLLCNKEKWQLAKMMGLTFCTSILELVTAVAIVLLAQVLNRPELGEKYLSFLGFSNLSQNIIILYFALSVGMIYLIKNLIAIVEVFYQHFSIQKMNYRFKKKLLQHYAQIDYSYYLTRNASQGHAVISSDTDLTFSSAMVSLTIIFSETIIFSCLIGLIIVMQPLLAFVLFGIGSVLSVLLINGLFPLFYQWGKKLQEFSLMGEKNLLQFFHAFKEIVLLGKRESFINAYHFYSRKKSRVQAIQNATNILPRMITELLFVTLFVLTIVYFCVAHIDPAQIVGILGGYLYAGFRLMPGLNRIITQLNIFKSIIPNIERVYFEYHQSAEKENVIDCKNFEFTEGIFLRNVYFRYPQAAKDTLRNINLTIKKGECIGIIGKTGSGESTLSDIILGLLLPYHGEVLVDKKYPVNSRQWHNCIGYVQQSIYLTDDTIKTNIAFGEIINNINLDQLHRSIQSAQLETFIQHLPAGIETIVGERGMRISGGERQRIAIARALYRNPEIFVFDEATSALDNETEAKLMATIDHIHQTQHTIILIAHRLSTLKHCNRIVVMENGEIKKIISYAQMQKEKELLD